MNPLECRGNYTAMLNNIKLIHWPLIGGLLDVVQQGRDRVGPAARPGPSWLYQM